MVCAHCEHAHACSHQCSIRRTVGVVHSVVSLVLSHLAQTRAVVQLRPLSFALHAHDIRTSACSSTRTACACHTRIYSVCIGSRGCLCLHTRAQHHSIDLCAPMSFLHSIRGPFLLAMSHCSHLKHHLLHHCVHAVIHFGVARHPHPEAADASHAVVEADPVLVCERVPAAGPTRADAATSIVTFKALGSLTPRGITSLQMRGKCAG